MLTMHGAIYLTLKTNDAVEERARRAAKIAALATIVLFAAAGAWIAWGIDGYVIKSAIDPNGPSQPADQDRASAIRTMDGQLSRA